MKWSPSIENCWMKNCIFVLVDTGSQWSVVSSVCCWRKIEINYVLTKWNGWWYSHDQRPSSLLSCKPLNQIDQGRFQNIFFKKWNFPFEAFDHLLDFLFFHFISFIPELTSLLFVNERNPDWTPTGAENNVSRTLAHVKAWMIGMMRLLKIRRTFP